MGKVISEGRPTREERSSNRRRQLPSRPCHTAQIGSQARPVSKHGTSLFVMLLNNNEKQTINRKTEAFEGVFAV